MESLFGTAPQLGKKKKPDPGVIDTTPDPVDTGFRMPNSAINPDKNDRSIGEIAKDTAAGVATGFGNVAKTATNLYGLATGNMDNKAGQVIQSGLDSVSEWESPQLKRQKEDQRYEIDQAEGGLNKFGKAFSSTVTNPALFGDFLATQIPNFIPSAAAGRVAAGVASRSLMKGAEGFAAKQAAKKTAGMVGTGAAVGVGAAQQGVDVGAETYQRMIAEGASPEIALAESRKAGMKSAAVGVGVNALPGARSLDRVLAGQSGGVTGKVRGVASGALGESASEAIEEGYGQFAGNEGVQTVKPEQDLMEGVGEAAGMGAVSGVFGGAAGLTARPPLERDVPTDENNPLGAPPGIMTPEQMDAQARAGMDPTTQQAIRESQGGFSAPLTGEAGSQLDGLQGVNVPPAPVDPRTQGVNTDVPVTGTGAEYAPDTIQPGGIAGVPSAEAAPSTDAAPEQLVNDPTKTEAPEPASNDVAEINTPEQKATSSILNRRADRYTSLAEAESDPSIRRDLERQADNARKEAKGLEPKLTRKERSDRNRKVDPAKDDLLTAVAKMGGVDTDIETDLKGRLSGFKTPRGMYNVERPSKKDANTIDGLGEKLIEEGYLQPTKEGNGVDGNAVIDLLERAAAGEPIYSLQVNAERQLESYEERYGPVDETEPTADLTQVDQFLTRYPDQLDSYMAQAESRPDIDPADIPEGADTEAKSLAELRSEIVSLGVSSDQINKTIEDMATAGESTPDIMAELFSYTQELRNAKATREANRAEAGQPAGVERGGAQPEAASGEGRRQEEGQVDGTADGSTIERPDSRAETRSGTGVVDGGQRDDAVDGRGGIDGNIEPAPESAGAVTPDGQSATDGRGGVDEALLSTYDETELAAAAEAKKKAASEQKKAEQKADVQAGVDSFSLTGSDQETDLATAAGQTDLLSPTDSTKPANDLAGAPQELAGAKQRLGTEPDLKTPEGQIQFAINKGITKPDGIKSFIKGLTQKPVTITDEQIQAVLTGKAPAAPVEQAKPGSVEAPQDIGAPTPAAQAPSLNTNEPLPGADAPAKERFDNIINTPDYMKAAPKWQSLSEDEQKSFAKYIGLSDEAITRDADGVQSLDAGQTMEAMSNVRKTLYGDEYSAGDKPKASAAPAAAIDAIDAAANESATSDLNDLTPPTEPQKKAGNYKKGRIPKELVHGLDISIENPKGSIREGQSKSGKRWQTVMKQHYGDFLGTTAADGDPVDVFIADNASDASLPVFVVDQITPGTRKYDEAKVIMGASTEKEARQIYQSNYSKGWKGLGAITPMSLEEFKAWVKTDAAKKPVSYQQGKKASPSTESATSAGNPKKADVVEADGDAKQGTIGIKLAAKEQVKTKTGRVTAPFPRIDFGTDRKAQATVKRTDKWLMAEALAEAEANGDNFNARSFRQVLENDKQIQQADKDSAEEYLFGDSAPVKANGPIGKPLVTPEATNPTEAATADKPAAAPTAKPEAAPAEAKPAKGASNTLFTQSAADAARARLKAKLGQTNSGFDPETLQDAVIVAGFHVEAGVRSFADFTKAMVEDIGEGIRPFLRGTYENLRYYPGLDTEGFSTAAEIEAAEKGNVDVQPDDSGAVQDESTADNEGADKSGEVRADSKPDGTTAGGSTGRGRSGSKEDTEQRPDSQNAEVKPDKVESAGSGDSTTGRGSRSDGPATTNYRITETDQLGKGGAKTKARQNIAAIKIVKKLADENRPATADEQAALVKYTGWGSSELANGIFPNKKQPKADWKALHEEVKSLLTDEQWAEASRSTQYAHYTSESVVRVIYEGLEMLGHKGGLTLEPGLGVGHFVGLMPKGMAANTHYTGIEYDGITAAIASALYPQSNIKHADFTRFTVPENRYDLVIGNPPFASTKIRSDKKYRKHGFNLHEYFFAKSIDSARPGGVLVFVTSRYLMDRADAKARTYLSERADLLGAVRLPQTAFKANAGTEVVTDVLFFQKREEGAEPAGQPWSDMVEISTADGPTNVNQYFQANPGQVLGTHALQGSMYGPNEYTVLANDTAIEDDFRAALDALPMDVVKASGESVEDRIDATAASDFAAENRKMQSIYLKDGVLMQVEDGIGKPMPIRGGKVKTGLFKTQAALIEALVPVKETAIAMLDAQLNGRDYDRLQKQLNTNYDAFVTKHGPINKVEFRYRKNKEGGKDESEVNPNLPKRMFEDPDAAILYTLDTHDAISGKVSKGAILTERVLSRQKTADVKTPGDALAASLNRHGAIDVPFMAEQLSMSEQDVIESLGDLIYQNPVSDQYETQDEYLSGRVRAKLAEAKVAAESNALFDRNVKALQAVQPTDIPPSGISVRFGASWLPTEVVDDFVEQELGAGVKSSYHKVNSSWTLMPDTNKPVNDTLRAGFITERAAFKVILDAALNQRSIQINDPVSVDGKTRMVINKEQTELAREKVHAMRDAFDKWVFRDATRATDLSAMYNENFNDIVPRKFNGEHLTLPGMSTRFQLRSHQKRVVWRQIQSGNTYMAHSVGSGKTLASIAGAMEQKRLGLIKKPMFAVPNHMLKQFAKEFLEAYPAAKILVADEESFSKDKRTKFVARSATENWDAVIITHSAFGLIKAPAQTEQSLIEKELNAYREALEQIDEEDRVSRKRMEKMIENLEQGLSEVQSRNADDGISFEQTGVDMLYVDEAHEFRKLSYATSQGNVKGIDPNGSQKAWDLYVKTRHLKEQNPKRFYMPMSGTPITNTMAELFTIQRFMQEDYLEEKGLNNFDSWSMQYADTKAITEQTPSGGYKVVTRMAKFINLPELVKSFRDVADIIRPADLVGSVRVPQLKGGAMEVVAVPATPAMKRYQKTLADRMDAIEARKGPPKPGDDIMLTVITDGRHAAIDDRYIDPAGPATEESKLGVMINNAYQSWEDGKDTVYYDSETGEAEPVTGSTQMIFADLGVSSTRGFSAYDQIKQSLVDKGVPPEQIAFMRDYKKGAAKLKLFSDMNSGRKRILIGSSKNMGTGVNAQQRLIDLHHMDAPWYPADMEQRMGRIVRQGNKNKTVSVRGYATKGTYDSTMFTMLETKQRFIDQMWSDDFTTRDAEDVDGDADQYAIAKAISSGDERLITKIGLENDVSRLERLKAAHEDQQVSQSNKRNQAVSAMQWADVQIKELSALLSKVIPTHGDKFKALIDGREYDERKKAAAALIQRLRKLDAVADRDASDHEVGSLGGFPMIAYVSRRITNKDGSPGPRADVVEVAMDIPNIGSIGAGIEQSPLGLLTKLENQVQSIDRQIARYEQMKVESDTHIATADAIVGKPFDRADELQEKTKELHDLEQDILNTPDNVIEDESEPATKAPNMGARVRNVGRAQRGTRLSREKGATSTRLHPTSVTQIARKVSEKWDGGPGIVVAMTGTQLPRHILDDAKAQGAPANEIKAVFKNGTVYLVADKHTSTRDVEESIFHEVYGHFGMARLFGAKVNRAMASLHKELGGDAGIRRMAEKYGIDLSDYEAGTAAWSAEQRGSLLANELLAHIAQKETGTLRQKAKFLIQAIREWLANHGFANLAKVGSNNADRAITGLLKAAQEAVDGAKVSQPNADAAMFMVAYHGTPHTVDKFSNSKIGTGEGAQAYGYGTYYASNRSVAQHYRDALTRNKNVFEKDDKEVANDIVLTRYENEVQNKYLVGDIEYGQARIVKLRFMDSDKTIEELRAHYAATKENSRDKSISDQTVAFLDRIIADGFTRTPAKKGNLYQVELAPKEDEYLLWDEALDGQSDKFKDAVKDAGYELTEYDDMGDFYADLANDLDGASIPENAERYAEGAGMGSKSEGFYDQTGDQKASKVLHHYGIRGIKYLDGSSRSKGEGNYNYVIFDDNDVEITAQLRRVTGAEAEALARKQAKKANIGIKRYLKRNLTKEGLTNKQTHTRGIEADGMKNVGEFQVSAIVKDLTDAMTQAYGKKFYNSIPVATLEKVNDYIVAGDEKRAEIDRDAPLPPRVRRVAVAMRDYLDRQSAGMIGAVSEIIQFQMEDLTQAQRDAIQEYHDTGGESGKPTPEHIEKNIQLRKKIQGNMGVYLNRSYQAFDDANWKDKVLENTDLMTRAKAFIAEANPDLTAGELTGAVRAILQSAANNGNFMSFLSKGAKQGSKDISITKKRKDVPPIIRELLGEYKDPKLNFARSSSSMQWYVANHHFLANVRRDGLDTFLFKKPTNEFDQAVADEGSDTMNPLNGLYSTVDFEQGLQDATNKFEGSELMRNLIGLNSLVKYGKTLLSPTTQFRNFQSAAMFTVMNGHFDWSHMAKAGKATWADLVTKDESWREYINELVEMNVIHNNPYAGELRDAVKDFTNMDSFAKGPKQNMKRFFGVVQQMYSAGDDFWKIIGFNNELDQLVKSGMGLDAAKKLAAQRIRDGYPTYTQVPRGIKMIRRWPLIGTFVSFPYESIRTTYNQLGFIKEDLAAGRKGMATRRMMGFALASASAYAISKASMALMGMDDEDDEAVRNQMPPWSRNSQLVYMGYDENGAPRYMDMSYLDPYTYLKKPITAMMSGNNVGLDKKIIDAMTELVEPFIGVDIAAGAAIEIAMNKRIGGGTVYNEADTSGRKAAAILNHAWKATRPGVMNNIERTILAIEGDVSPSGRVYTLKDEAYGFLGHRVSTLNVPQSVIYRGYEFNDMIRNATSILSRKAGQQNKLSDSEVKSAYEAMQKARQKAFTDMSRLVAGARQLGLSDSDLMKIMKVSRISEANRRAIIAGKVPQWAMSKRFTTAAEQRAQLSAADRKRQAEIPVMMRQRRELIQRLIRDEHDYPDR